MMVAGQNKDIPMLNALLEAGGNVNLAQPALTYADGYGYGGTSFAETTDPCPLVRALLDIHVWGRC
jgi:hypothetical protein